MAHNRSLYAIYINRHGISTSRFAIDMKPAGPGRRSIRLVTSWATSPEQVDAFLAALDRLSPSGQF